MKTSTEVTPAKLRGGFYSPESLVQACLDRVATLSAGGERLRVLEPSAGDGAFIRGLASHPLRMRVSSMTAVELLGSEAAACEYAMRDGGFAGEVIHGSFLTWVAEAPLGYDIAVGNPPFVRFQFIQSEERDSAAALHTRMGLSVGSVSNLWVPVFLGALQALRPGGAYSFIVPAEILTGVSAHAVREWLLENTRRVHLDLFAPGSFPGVLQEVVVISGRICDTTSPPTHELHIREERADGVASWTHSAADGLRTWTRYLLTRPQVDALAEAASLPSVRPLSAIARVEVATVTGANGFFCVDDTTLDRYSLHTWARPLLPRTRHAAGLRFTVSDHASLASAGEKAWLLDFSSERPNPEQQHGPRRFLSMGVVEALPDRYKCRIRTPWYRVPVVPPGQLLMAKRSHIFPRMIVNDAGVVTTDTIYRGRILQDSPLDAPTLAATFHNSLTILTAEVEGRSFGGGVLELVPSEIARLLIPVGPRIGAELDRLDWVSRTREASEDEALVEETDELVGKHVAGLTPRLMSELRGARESLLQRRLSRN